MRNPLCARSGHPAACGFSGHRTANTLAIMAGRPLQGGGFAPASCNKKGENDMLDKRAFLVAAAGLAAAAAARAQEAVPRNGYNPARTIPHGLVKTSKLFKSPPGFVNGMAVAPEGLWLAQQGIS